MESAMESQKTRLLKAGLAAFVWIVIVPNVLQAQSAIAGVVKDTTDAVLPGVTVEASSSALIEKVRSVVTDGAGQFRIIDLRPGIYSVTFTLPGFGVVKREGIELVANFTATINAQLGVSSVEQSIVVSGQSPVVDLQNTTQQQVLTQALLDAVPTSRNIGALGGTIPSITLNTPDVGGTNGMGQTTMAVHGSDAKDNSVQIDGMNVNGVELNGAIQQYFNLGMFEELTYQTSALPAEVQGGGVRLNMIPKAGGNEFRGSLFYSDEPGQWESTNVDSALRQLGFAAPGAVQVVDDLNLSLGGPFVRDRLWFFSGYRRWGVDQLVANSFYNLDPTHVTYQPDLSHQVDNGQLINSGITRLTTRFGDRHKVSAYLDRIFKYLPFECTALAAEEACGVRDPNHGIYYTAQAKYTGTWTSKMLFEAGVSINNESYQGGQPQPGVLPTDIPRTDLILGTIWGNYSRGAGTAAVPSTYWNHIPVRWTYVSSLTYNTGSHALKAGIQFGQGKDGNTHQLPFGASGPSGINLIEEYRSGVPSAVAVYNTPVNELERIKYDAGFYAQDTWTFKRLTLNPGIRFEFFNSYVPAQSAPAGRFVPARQFAEIDDLPNWKDVAPRFGAVYDLFGDGRTAVKFSVGKFMAQYATGYAATYNPMGISIDQRTWTDLNHDGIAEDNEIGPSSNNLFGLQSTEHPASGIRRPYEVDYNLSVQREIAPGVSLSAGWVQRNFHRIIWSDNVAVGFSDYTPVTIANPLNGESLVVYNLNPAKLGLVNLVDQNSDQNQRWYNGVDFGINARVGSGTVFGGMSTGRQERITCQVSDPNFLRFCDWTKLDIPFFRPQWKVAGSYPLPFAVRVSGSFQSYPGGSNLENGGSTGAGDPSLNVNYLVNRSIIPSLTQTQVSVQLVPPGSEFLPRWNQVDMRFARKFQVKGLSLQPQLDLFNLLNANPIIAQVQTFGAALGRPTNVLLGRLVAIGVQANF
jgi:hypothetical protein